MYYSVVLRQTYLGVDQLPELSNFAITSPQPDTNSALQIYSDFKIYWDLDLLGFQIYWYFMLIGIQIYWELDFWVFYMDWDLDLLGFRSIGILY